MCGVLILRRSGWDAPPCIFQDEKTGKAAEAVRGRVKVGDLKGDSHYSNLVIIRRYPRVLRGVSRILTKEGLQNANIFYIFD